MPRKGANISLSSYDDIFETDTSRNEAKQERVQEIPLSELHPFEGHPFKVVDDEEMQKTVESVRDFGVLTPAIARPDPDGGYEIISGHRRHRASELAGKETMPVIVREMDDDAAIILMVDANLQRETILPSERAFAYKMKLDAIKHQGARSDLTSDQVGPKLEGQRANELLAQQVQESKTQVQRYIRLNKLIPALMDHVDNGTLKLVAAADFLSHLTEKEQSCLLLVMEQDEAIPSMAQARQMKELSQEGKLEQGQIERIMREEKPLEHKITLDGKWVQKRFPKHMTPRQIKERINKALDLLERMEHQKQGHQR